MSSHPASSGGDRRKPPRCSKNSIPSEISKPKKQTRRRRRSAAQSSSSASASRSRAGSANQPRRSQNNSYSQRIQPFAQANTQLTAEIATAAGDAAAAASAAEAWGGPSRTRSGIQPACSICGLRVSCVEEVAVHLALVHEGVPFCHICGTVVSCEEEIDVHIALYHE
ncbi:hypothetical protein FGB62_284g02 [Gracilaria domingensis]|nr:hypothetical protein FGB62_284g02 [Gracilaria domingensis]